MQRYKDISLHTRKIHQVTEAYFILNIAHIFSQLGFFWSDLTVKLENTQFEEQGLNQSYFKGLAQKKVPTCQAVLQNARFCIFYEHNVSCCCGCTIGA